MKRLRSRLPVVLVVAGLAIAGCGSGGKTSSSGGAGGGQGSANQLDSDGFVVRSGPAQKGGTVQVLGSVDFSHLDPAMGNDGNVNNFYRLIYRTLTTYANEPGDGGTKVVPDLATDTGKRNEDATVWTYTLKDNVFFQDGTPITSKDIKFGFEHSLDPAVAIGNADGRSYIDGADKYKGVFTDPKGLSSIETPDAKTIVFHLNQPLAGFPDLVTAGTFVPFPADQVKNSKQIDTTPIASGPYQIKSYTRGSELVLERNPKWSADTDTVRPAYPDAFRFLFGIDQNTIDQRMISDQSNDKNAVAAATNPLTAASVARIQQPAIKSRVVRDIPACTIYLGMNMTKKPLDDLKVRQAISYGINKTSVIAAGGGPLMATPASDMLTPKVPGRTDFDLYPSDGNNGDVAKAKQLLTEAGFPNGFEVTMDARALPKWQSWAVAIQASLKELGIDVKLNVIDASTYYEVIGTPAKQHDMAITGWCSPWLSGIPLLTPLFAGDRITDKGNYNLAQIDDPTINKRIADVGKISDLDKQNTEFGALDKEIMELAPVLPLLRETPLQMVGSNVGNAFAHAGETGYIDYSSLGLKNP